MKYREHFDHKTGLYGVKNCNDQGKAEKGWWIKPSYDAIGSINAEAKGWFKKNGKFGYLDVASREELIPAEYGYPIYFSRDGFATTWKDYRAGVINLLGQTVIPFRYDEIHYRQEPLDEKGRKMVFRGFVCRCEDGTRDVYDENCRPDELREWDNVGRDLSCTDKDNEALSIEELEEKIKENYLKLIQMGYHSQMDDCFSKEHLGKIKEVEQIVKDAIYDRRQKINLSWRHNRENAARISRLNDLHIRNIIARMGELPNADGTATCFEHTSYNYDSKDWTPRNLFMDDGQTWGEGIHHPAYQDVYFLFPFHLLYFDYFNYSLEDLASINDFRVEVKVELQTKELMRRLAWTEV